ncbi:hypothetical protein RRG08_051625 [Elysia crispata]|uniref:Uncharacterized protein n=1 Tax=Elysia crispata TaxID=231223 RepID=A0AAE1A4G6_9GAST|nr:hypothetical protein RRG08_051625 [Elysia crispata]
MLNSISASSEQRTSAQEEFSCEWSTTPCETSSDAHRAQRTEQTRTVRVRVWWEASPRPGARMDSGGEIINLESERIDLRFYRRRIIYEPFRVCYY